MAKLIRALESAGISFFLDQGSLVGDVGMKLHRRGRRG